MCAPTGCSYGVDYADCEVSCTAGGDDVCPDGFSCMAGLCRVAGAGGACMAPGQITLRQTADDKPERSLVFGCTNPDGTTSDGSWYRVFPLAEALDVQAVSLGICFAVGNPTLQIKIGTYGGGAGDTTLDLTKITTAKTADLMVTETQISKLAEVPIAGSFPAGANLIVEVAVPDLDGSGQQVNMGFTAGSELKPGYVRSPLCGPGNPMTTSSAGLPNARLVLTVTGNP